jgi:alpha-D-ribose 1-methylphosphonate 5-triphosphate synthase subunit PhnH
MDPKSKRYAIAAAAVLLAILHQDVWLWTDTKMVFGFIPMGLAYHAVYSIAAAALGALAAYHAWPHALEAFADAPVQSSEVASGSADEPEPEPTSDSDPDAKNGGAE